MTEKLFLQDLLNNPDKIGKLTSNQLLTILNQSKTLFKNEFVLLEFDYSHKKDEIYIIGDIHGNLGSLLKLIDEINKNKPKIVVFLGDIVDRGPYQLECFVIVLCLKLMSPNTYYLLKGNHETLEMNKYYGFYTEFTHKFDDKELYDVVLSLYDVLPLCAIINKEILCLHGGIPEDFDILKKFKAIKSDEVYSNFKSFSSSILQILWNDPKETIIGFIESFRGPGIKFFGEDAFEKFMERNSLSFLIRAHEWFPEGFRWFFQNRLLSIFSSSNYRGEYNPNPASYAVICKGRINLKILH